MLRQAFDIESMFEFYSNQHDIQRLSAATKSEFSLALIALLLPVPFRKIAGGGCAVLSGITAAEVLLFYSRNAVETVFTFLLLFLQGGVRAWCLHSRENGR